MTDDPTMRALITQAKRELDEDAARFRRALSQSSSAGALDTSNQFVVGGGALGIVVQAPPLPGAPLTEAEALNLAAWLVAIVARRSSSVGAGDRFLQVLEAIENT